jgi:hypothetical protein
MTQKKTGSLNQYQRRYLQEELREHRYNGSFDEPKEPPAVKQARKVVEGWDKHVRALRASYDAARSKKRAEALKMLNFGSPEQALAAVEAFKASP